jgi:hypothetical protein
MIEKYFATRFRSKEHAPSLIIVHVYGLFLQVISINNAGAAQQKAIKKGA